MSAQRSEPDSDKHRQTERQQLQALLSSRRKSGSAPSQEAPGAFSATTIERDGDLLFVFEDGGDRHARRVQRAVKSGWDRIFWITITIACGKPGFVPGAANKNIEILAKQYGRLEKARNDLDAFHEYYLPMLIGDPFVVGASPGLGKSPGFFIHPVYLNNPTVGQLRDAIDETRRWLDVNQRDPEYVSFQLNFCFSGHGDVDASGSAGIVLADQKLGAEELSSLLVCAIPGIEVSPANCRLDLFLDCCHSAAIARSIHRSLSKVQPATEPLERSVLNIGQVYCACLDDEEAFEFEHLRHSVFTFAFLNECSRTPPAGASTSNLGLRDIGWYTQGLQHPLLLDFTASGGPAVKFPSLFHLTHSPRWSELEASRKLPKIEWTLTEDPTDHAPVAIDAIGDIIRYAQAVKSECQILEGLLWNQPETRIPFTRDEVLTNRRFPFL